MQLNETESLSSYFLSQNNIRRNKMKWVNEWNDNDILFFKQILYFMMNKYEVLETPIKYLHPLPPPLSLSFSHEIRDPFILFGVQTLQTESYAVFSRRRAFDRVRGRRINDLRKVRERGRYRLGWGYAREVCGSGMGVTRRAATRGVQVTRVAQVASPDAPCRAGPNLALVALGSIFLLFLTFTLALRRVLLNVEI